MKWRKIAKSEYEKIDSKYDMYIRKERGIWVLDIFNHCIGNNKEAYIDSIPFNSKSEARKDAESYL